MIIPTYLKKKKKGGVIIIFNSSRALLRMKEQCKCINTRQ